MNEEVKIWPKEQITTFKKFHNLAMKRLDEGWAPDSVYRDKPSGYSEWVKTNYKETGGLKLATPKNIPKINCWNCNHEFPENYNKCPYCKRFNPDVHKYR